MPSELDALWGSTTFVKVLAALYELPDEELTFAELLARTRGSRESVHRALRRAMDAGLVLRRRMGNQFAYTTNVTSPVYPEVAALIAKSYGVQKAIASALSSVGPPGIETAFIFGSVASHRAMATSDIDLMVIGSATRFELADILKPVQERFSRRIDAIAYKRSEVERRLQTGDGFFLEVWSQPKNMLVGAEADLPRPPASRSNDNG